VILAAGESSRMGRPKALLRVGEGTFLERLIDVFAGVCDEVVVVAGRDAERIAAGTVNLSRARMVVNETPERGQSSSLQCGLKALGTNARRVFFHPVDAPLVCAETVGAMNALELTEALLVIPRCEGRRGHPVLALGEAVALFHEMREGSTARDIVHSLRDRTSYLDVEDRGVLGDVDTPEEYEALLQGGLR
jgi:molybdenum cofactor cytidylyltransferase